MSEPAGRKQCTSHCAPRNRPLHRANPQSSEAVPLILSPFEWTIAKRYMLPGRGEAVIALVASISIGVVMLSVAMLVIVMSVMNGFRAELIDKITGLNGHAIIQGYNNRIENWQQVLEETRETEG